ncbi:hypothetical protein A3H38_00375 [candidate division WOR-1 bacterium RIFCSPLOWO2_02_FULL_46_20]|uniref:Type I restriction modification DNA specificity domain-containing protein n=1 Tax=candidate division WOR-1 bacterium RIFCSPLOWO2_02_FULL_46_20 TaxID=1802567 RepID=A0A1F4R4W4_UNCSA|nr:MAG: hypothetical protein A3J44_06795 [candidate division WOR-1 bacterium RIFCSPHIGHO2_02_FULL_45_12]OGC03212.1 MAG: hypothetical protein A3H38_00375 [candidate division WOR-1 bacterium RIFCSPLOWO2_02_FULL_46_20]
MLSNKKAEFGRADTVKEKGFYVLPSELFINVRKNARNDANLNETLVNVFRNIENSAKGAKMPRGDKKAIMKYEIPIPEVKEQDRIVSVLNKLDALVGDISIGLPAELKARRSQYEYYRGKLLTFNAYAN